VLIVVRREMAQESPFILPSREHGVNFPHHASTTISMVPSGPEWIARQNQQEIMSLSWGWSDGTATVSREQVDALLKRVAFGKKRILGLVFVAAFTYLLWIMEDGPHGAVRIASIVSLLLCISAFIYWRILSTSQLSDMFSRGVLNKHTNHMMSEDKGKEAQIQVTVNRFVQWTPRQTPEEILSVEGWTEEDLTLLGPLLQRKKVHTYFTNGALLALLVYIFLPIISPRYHEWRFGDDRSEAVVRVICIIQMLVATYFIFWTRELNRRVEQMFASRFMHLLSGPSGGLFSLCNR
jgi:hypothetical protein